MNEYQRAMMGMSDVFRRCGELYICPFCGRPATDWHHIVPRSQGGTEGPRIRVCGPGNAGGCHGRLHGHTLHLKAENGCWWYLETEEPVKYDEALAMEGWVMM